MNKKDSLGTTLWEPREFIGKIVVDHKGKKCGKIKSIYINPKTLSMSGVHIKNGFRTDYFLPSDYFDRFSETALHLNTIPVKPNDKVINQLGKNVGRVKKIHRNSLTNKIENLEINSRLKHSRLVPVSDMVAVGDKITIKT